MKRPGIWPVLSSFAGALVGVAAFTGQVSAAPQELHCVLTDVATRPASESRPLIVVFDDDARTLKVEDDKNTYDFTTVSISNVTINGESAALSLGIDRSSLGIVWQKYGTTGVTTEFGRCQRAADAPAMAR